jgi:site-specific DNA recombinase
LSNARLGKDEIVLAVQQPDPTAHNRENDSPIAEIRIPWNPPKRTIPVSQLGRGPAEVDQKVVQALIRAHGWATALTNNEFTSIEQLAATVKLHPKVVRTELRLAFLAPHITGSILNGDFRLRLPRLRNISALSWRTQLDQLH